MNVELHYVIVDFAQKVNVILMFHHMVAFSLLWELFSMAHAIYILFAKCIHFVVY
jgi:hypothetical protein